MRTIEHWIGGKATGRHLGPDGAGLQPGDRRAAGRGRCWPSASDVEAAVAAASDAFAEWSQTSLSKRTKVLFAFRELVNAHAGELAEMITDEHGKVLSDAIGEVQRGLEVVEFACGIPQLLKGEYSDQVSTGRRRRSRFRAAARRVSPGSRRSTSRRWCRCGCSRSRSPAATPSCSSRASATRRRRS